MSATAERAQRVRSADGTPLEALIAAPRSPSGLLLMCHGLTTDRDEHGLFGDVRDAALKRGLAAVRFDFRAHGRSGGDNEGLRLAGMRADAAAVLNWARTELGAELPFVVLGVSFGAGAAIDLAATEPGCAGLALWYGLIDYEWNYGEASKVPFVATMRAARSAQDPPWSGMPIPTTSWHIPAALLAEMAEDQTPLKFQRLALPVLAFHGRRDPFVYSTPLRALTAGRQNVEVRMLRGAGHGFILWRPWVVWRTARFARAAIARAR